MVRPAACGIKLTVGGGPQFAQPPSRALEAPVKGKDCGSGKSKRKTQKPLQDAASENTRRQSLLRLNVSTTQSLTEHRPLTLLERGFAVDPTLRFLGNSVKHLIRRKRPVDLLKCAGLPVSSRPFRPVRSALTFRPDRSTVTTVTSLLP